MTAARRFERNLEALDTLEIDLAGRDFLLTWERSLEEIRAVLLAADSLRRLHRGGRTLRLFDTGTAVSLFRDRSTRTRYSFASAACNLGLGLVEIDEERSQIAHGETVRETATMISFLTEVLGIRDDIYLGRGNRFMRDVGGALDEALTNGALARRPSVLNLQCDLDHPTQTLADLMHLAEHFGSLEALRGRTIAMSWAYSPTYGKPLSVPQGIVALLPRLGMNVVLAAPPGYDLLPEIEERARAAAGAAPHTGGGGTFRKVRAMEEAFRGADAVYPKSWAPMEILDRRTELLERGDRRALEELEKECLARNARFADWECDEEKMRLTRDGRALYMHCLPADISGVSCERGEVSRAVFERHRFETYREAGLKPYVIAAMILLGRFPEPARTLEQLAARGGGGGRPIP